MPRINIEDSLFKDHRFTDLCIKLGSRHAALGAFVEACILAQEHYLDVENGRLIPEKDWSRNPVLQHVLDVGLAEKRSKGFYVSGSEKQFSWLVQRSNAGRRGAERRIENVRRSLNDRHATEQRPNNGRHASFSSSYLTEIQLNTTVPTELDKTPRGVVGHYCNLYSSRYKSRPPVTGKDVGILARLEKDLGKAKVVELLDAYFQMPDSWVVARSHSLELFVAKRNEIQRYISTGNVVTQTQTREVDRAVNAEQKWASESAKVLEDASNAGLFEDSPKALKGRHDSNRF